MTKKHLQSLTQAQLIETAMKMRILPSNFLEIRCTAQENTHENGFAQGPFSVDIESGPSSAVQKRLLLDTLEHQDLIDEVFEQLTDQHLESINDLASPLLESMHKFELEPDRTSGMVPTLTWDYFADRLGLTKNKLHFILRDMEWGVIFWQLSTDIKNIVVQNEQDIKQRIKQQDYDGAALEGQYDAEEESSLSIIVHESPTMPKFGRQSKLGSFRGNYIRDYYEDCNNSMMKSQDGLETYFYSFSVNSADYKRYVFLCNNCSYYWAELYHHNINYCCKVLLARSSIIYKPQFLHITEEPCEPTALESLSNQNSRKLYELSSSVPEGIAGQTVGFLP